MGEATNVYGGLDEGRRKEIREVIMEVYSCLKQKGYDPVGQIMGYILSEDPTYITAEGGARAKMGKLDRHEILDAILQSYLDI